MATITVELEGEVLQRVTLSKERITIGRRPHNDIVLDMRAVSAEHAAIVTILHDSFLEDLNSTNGTQVNGQTVRKHFLQNQDVIKLAKYEIRYQSDTLQNGKTAAVSQTSAFANTQVVDEQVDPATVLHHDPVAQDVSFLHGVPVIRVLSGPTAGEEVALTKSLTTIGCPGVQVAVITRRGQEFLITHVEGGIYPLVEGASIGASAHPIVSGNIIELSGTRMEFLLR